MAVSNELNNVPVSVLNRSAFNKSFKNLLTLKVGTLVPVLTDEVIPDTTIDLKGAFLAKLPPLASDTFMNVKLHLEAFFVPYRILYGGFTKALTMQDVGGSSYGLTNSRMPGMPRLKVVASSLAGFKRFAAPNGLPDYLGFKYPADLTANPSTDLYVNIFPFLCYHRIYDDWYRNPLVQKPVFVPAYSYSGSSHVTNVDTLPYTIIEGANDNPGGSNFADYLVSFTGSTSDGTPGRPDSGSALNDGKFVTELRQRNFGKDYFTSATPTPTIGATPNFVISTTTDLTSGQGNGSFTIGALRSVNSLTQFAERNAVAGTRYADFLKANYGVKLSADVEGRAQYLGRVVLDVYNQGISQTSRADGEATANPFDTVGAQYGNALASGEGNFVNNFYVREPGLVMVLASLVPSVTYSTGAARYLRHFTADGWRANDLANQILENVGPQPIFKSELDGSKLWAGIDEVFGYTDRFAEYKTKPNELHGLMRDGSSLEAFALQRSVAAGGAVLSSSFIEIPQNYLDQVSAVQGQISQYGAWLDCFFDYKVVQPLSKYSQPSLVMPSELRGHIESVSRAGSHL